MEKCYFQTSVGLEMIFLWKVNFGTRLVQDRFLHMYTSGVNGDFSTLIF